MGKDKELKQTQRKGARALKDIPAEILQKLNSGEIESANLTEWLAIDQKILLSNLLNEIAQPNYLDEILNRIKNLKKQSVNSINETIGKALFELANGEDGREILNAVSAHRSDMVRCWAAYMTACDESLDISATLNAIRVFAADSHFGVREIAWLWVRGKIISNLDESVKILSKFALDEDANIRRFASEATRPRGVWCEHINTLKAEPWRALAILEPLKSDSSKYVQDSVANWLNDASKTQAEFVREICSKWSEQSKSKQTAYILKRALRTLNKNLGL
ncbi:hypothetical protein [Campylobacter sp.]|uniref:hypothetical protein n=1 Tax=Campylobacter sp. TaxID=205 RepID=UPI0026FEA25C|nr:hypothetical protein [Campylobacter sp.]